jgi:hypothetical protein
MMRTKVRSQQRDAAPREFGVYPMSVVEELSLGVVTPGYAGLIGDYHKRETVAGGLAAKVEDPGYPLGLLRRMHVTMIDIHHAVAIQEQRPPRRHELGQYRSGVRIEVTATYRLDAHRTPSNMVCARE